MYGSHHKQQQKKLLKISSYSQGCQAGSIRQRLSKLFAAATRVLTLLSPPSNWARLWSRVMIAVTAFWTSETSCWLSIFSGCPAAESGEEVSSCVFLCHAIISSRSTVFRMPSTYRKRKIRLLYLIQRTIRDYRIVTRFLSMAFWHFWSHIAISVFSRWVWLPNYLHCLLSRCFFS